MYGYKPQHQLFRTNFLQKYINMRAHVTKLNLFSSEVTQDYNPSLQYT